MQNIVNIFKNIVSQDEITCLLEYFKIVDVRTDTRPDVTSKHPQWDIDVWPQEIVKRILDRVLEKNYSVDEVIFNQSKISFGLHADSGTKDQDIYKAILIPLVVTEHSGTAFFNNHWHYTSAKFTHQPFDPLIYTVFDFDNNPVKVNLDEFLLDRDADKFPTYSDECIEKLIKTRLTSNQYSKTDSRTNEYEKITGYIANKKFDKDIYNQYLNHINYEDLTGLTLDKIVPWQPGDVIVFDRTQLHCATHGHKVKIGITIFTDLA
jgi:hypothetical protein